MVRSELGQLVWLIWTNKKRKFCSAGQAAKMEARLRVLTSQQHEIKEYTNSFAYDPPAAYRWPWGDGFPFPPLETYPCVE